MRQSNINLIINRNSNPYLKLYRMLLIIYNLVLFVMVNIKCLVAKKIISKSVNDRLKLLRELKLCMNSLRSGHVLRDCKSSNCKQCNQPHHSLLHFKSSPSTEQ